MNRKLLLRKEGGFTVVDFPGNSNDSSSLKTLLAEEMRQLGIVWTRQPRTPPCRLHRTLGVHWGGPSDIVRQEWGCHDFGRSLNVYTVVDILVGSCCHASPILYTVLDRPSLTDKVVSKSHDTPIGCYVLPPCWRDRQLHIYVQEYISKFQLSLSLSLVGQRVSLSSK